MPSVGTNIRMRREAEGLTQLRLAIRLGTTPQTVANWETGRSNLTVPMLLKIARELGTTANALMDGIR